MEDQELEILTRADTSGLDDLKQGVEEMASAIEESGTSVEETGDKAERSEGKFGKLGGTISKITGMLAGLSVVAAGLSFATGVVDDVFEWDSAMRTFQATTGATNEEMEGFRANAQEVFVSGFAESIQDSVTAMRDVQNITGLVGDNLVEATNDALALAQAYDMDVTESIRAVDSASDAFGSNSEEIYDNIAYTIQNVGDANGDLLDTINEYGPILSEYGFTVDEFFALLNSGAEEGIYNFDKIGDATKEFGIRVKEGGDEVQAAFNAMAETQAVFYTVNDDRSTTFLDSWDDIQDALADGSLSVADFSQQAATALLAIEDPIERQKAAVALLGPMYEDLGDDILTAMAESGVPIDDVTGSMDAMQEKMQSGLGPTWTRFTRQVRTAIAQALTPVALTLLNMLIPALEDLGDFVTGVAIPAIVGFSTELGDVLLPILNDLEEPAVRFIDSIRNIAQRIREFMADNPKLVEMLSFVAGALGALGAAAVIVPAIIGAVTAAAGALATVLGVLLSPIVLVIAALAALGFAYKENLFGFKDAVDQVLAAVGDALQAIAGFVSGLVDAFQEGGFEAALQYVVDNLIEPLLDKIRNVDWLDAVSTLWTHFKNAVMIYLALYVQAGKLLNDYVIQPMFDYLSTVDWGGVLDTLWSAFKTVMTTYVGLYWKAGEFLLEHVIQPALDYLGQVNWGEVASTLWSNFKTMMSMAIALNFIVSTWINEHIITPVFESIKNINWANVVTDLWARFKQAMNLAITLLFIASTYINEHVTQPIKTAIQSITWENVINTVGNLGGRVFSLISDTLPDIGAWVSEHITGPLASALSGIADIVKAGINEAIPDHVGVTLPAIRVGPGGSITLYGGGEYGIDIPNPFAEGGITGSGMSKVGERGEELAIFPEGTRIIPNNELFRMTHPTVNQVSMKQGGGGDIYIDKLYVTGVEDVESLYDKLQKIKRERVSE